MRISINDIISVVLCATLGLALFVSSKLFMGHYYGEKTWETVEFVSPHPEENLPDGYVLLKWGESYRAVSLLDLSVVHPKEDPLFINEESLNAAVSFAWDDYFEKRSKRLGWSLD